MFEEIIKADLGGFKELTSSVFLFDTLSNVMFHLYDDRGLDIVVEERKPLYPIYKKYNEWILNYDRERIQDIFEK